MLGYNSSTLGKPFCPLNSKPGAEMVRSQSGDDSILPSGRAYGPPKMGTMGMDKQRSSEIIFNLKGYYRKDGVATGCVSYCPSLNIFSHGKDSSDARDHLWKAVRLYIETSLKNNTLNNTVEKLMKAAEYEPGEIEQEFVVWVKEKEFDTAFDMAIPFSLHRPGRAM